MSQSQEEEECLVCGCGGGEDSDEEEEDAEEQQQSQQEATSAFKVGDQVEGARNEVWYKATIEKINVDGTYTLKWNDGNTLDKVKPAAEIRRLMESYLGWLLPSLLAVAMLLCLLVQTNKLTRKMYSDAKFPQEVPRHVQFVFHVGLFGSVILSLGVPLVHLLRMGSLKEKGMAILTVIPLWTGMFIAIGFAFMVVSFKASCSDVSGSFVHADCIDQIHSKRLEKNFGPNQYGIKAKVAGAGMGILFGVSYTLAILAMGRLVEWLRSRYQRRNRLEQNDSRHFLLSLAATCTDFMDWQDITLLLIDDDFLKGSFAKDNDGTAWHLLFAWCVLSFFVITGTMAYQFYYAIGKISKQKVAPDGKGLTNEKKEKRGPDGNGMTCPERCCAAASLFFIEIPFLAFRAYIAIRFNIVPSSLILKNLVSVPKEMFEVWNHKNAFGTHELIQESVGVNPQ